MTASPRRGAHLLDAVVRIVAEGGLCAVSMRAVAVEAGVSLAQVQYYFHSKGELVAAAFEHVSDGVEQRAAGVDDTGSSQEVLRRLLELWLPLDAERARDARVWLAFTASVASSEPLRTINIRLDRALRAGFADLLRAAQAAGELDPTLDPEVHAGVLLAVVDGLVTQAVIAPPDGGERLALATAGVEAHLSLLFGAEKS